MQPAKRLGLIVLAVILTGCATSPVQVADSRSVPSERLLPGFAAFAATSANSAKVVVVRDAGIFGSGAKAKLLVDGIPVATFWKGERLEFFVAPGEHIFGVLPQPQLMGALVESSFTFEAGKARYFRISISETSLRVQPTTQIQ